MPLRRQAQHTGRVQGRLLRKLRKTQNVKLHERQTLRQNDVARDAAAVRRNCIDHETAVVALGFRKHDAGHRRIDVETAAHIRTGIFPEFQRFFARHQVGIAARVVNDESLPGQNSFLHPVAVFGETEFSQAVPRYLGLNLPGFVARQTRAVLRRNVAFAEDVGVLLQKIDRNCHFFQFVLDRAAAVGIDVREMQRIAVRHRHGFLHALDVGTVFARAGMPSDVGAAFKCSLDEKRRHVGFQGVVSAQKFHAERPVFKALVDESFHLRLRGVVVFEGKGGRRKLQNRHVDPGAVFGDFVKDVFQGPRHIQARRHALHREHPCAVGAAPHTAQMHVAVDDAGLQDVPREVDDFLGVPRKIAPHGGNLAVFHRHIGLTVDVVQRIDHMSALDEKIKHRSTLLFYEFFAGATGESAATDTSYFSAFR